MPAVESMQLTTNMVFGPDDISRIPVPPSEYDAQPVSVPKCEEEVITPSPVCPANEQLKADGAPATVSSEGDLKISSCSSTQSVARSSTRSRSSSWSTSRPRSRSMSSSSSRCKTKSTSRSKSKSKSGFKSSQKTKSRSHCRSKSGSGSDSKSVGKSKSRSSKCSGSDSSPDKKRRIESRGENGDQEQSSSSQNGLEPDSNSDQMSWQMSDFDIMLNRRREERRAKRRRYDIEFINNNDDMISQLLHEMKCAAQEDRELRKNKQPAIRKISMLKRAMSQLMKKDLQWSFLEHDVLNVLHEWLVPLRKGSLPCFEIRESILKLLLLFPTIDKSRLKESGIGKAVMYLYKHPQETRENRDRAGTLIAAWARPLFKVAMDYKSLSREEIEARDKASSVKRPAKTHNQQPEAKRYCVPLRLARAEVPMPSELNYTVRPKCTSNFDMSKNIKKSVSRYIKTLTAFKQRSLMQNSMKRAVEVSIYGRGMAL